MKINIWTQCLLNSYNRLDGYVEQINKKVSLLALTEPNVAFGTTTEVIANKILKLVDKKITIIKTKVLIDKILMQMNKKYATMLKMKYVYKKTNREIAKYYEVSLRTVRRYVISALRYFAKNLVEIVKSVDALSKVYKNETWMAYCYYDSMRKYLKSSDNRVYKKFVRECNLRELKDYEYLYEYVS